MPAGTFCAVSDLCDLWSRTWRAEPSRGRDGTREAYLYSVTVGLNNRITYTFLFYLLVLNETFKKASMDIPQATASETPFRS